jgi:RNA polymerase sigma factor (sigma-70 family)
VELIETRETSDLYRDHAIALTRFATVLVGPDDAADVVADAVESLLASGRLVNADYPRALLYRAVLTKARSMQRSTIRRRAREQRVAQRLIEHQPDVQPEVLEAVARLSQRQRACIFLMYWEDITVAQIAERLGLGEGTVKRYLARARERLQEVLDER